MADCITVFAAYENQLASGGLDQLICIENDHWITSGPANSLSSNNISIADPIQMRFAADED